MHVTGMVRMEVIKPIVDGSNPSVGWPLNQPYRYSTLSHSIPEGDIIQRLP